MKRLAQRAALRASALPRHAVSLHRLAHRLHAKGHPTTADVVATVNRVLTGAEIEPGATLGAGFEIHHGNGIVIAEGVRAGRDLHVYQQVTLGVSWGGKPGFPTIGDRVVVFAGARVLGGVTIGDGAVVGANAVVLDDVPAGALAVGIPARVAHHQAKRAWTE